MKLRLMRFNRWAVVLVVAALLVPCGLVARQWQTVRQRQAVLTRLRDVGEFGILYYGEGRANPVPWVRRWLGDVGVAGVMLPPKFSESEADEVRAAFPEAVVRR